jgi:hypothetical protein
LREIRDFYKTNFYRNKVRVYRVDYFTLHFVIYEPVILGTGNMNMCTCENNQQDALYRLIYFSKSAIRVLGDVFAHHPERLTVVTVSCGVHPSCCLLVSRKRFNAVGTPAGSNLGEHHQIL